MKKQLFIFALIGLITFPLFAQDVAPKTERRSNKGRMYAFWGWNRGFYSSSDMHFTGKDYDFTLDDVRAFDRQSDFGVDPYFHPGKTTYPQTNLRIGYFINDKYDISFGVDHMKYIMRNEQTVNMNGYINDGTKYDGTYVDSQQPLDQDFLIFEHSDGLNYLNFEITRNDDLMQMLGINLNPDKVQINTLIGFGLGTVMPKTNATLWNRPRNDEFHFAGWGADLKAGLNATFFKYFFIRGEGKVGYMDMFDVLTSPDHADKMSHHFFFSQLNFDIGITLYPFKRDRIK